MKFFGLSCNKHISRSCPPHLHRRVGEVLAMPVSKPPSPWKELRLPLVGGLVEVGFSESNDYLLTITADGRGLIDCVTGAKVARDRDNSTVWRNWPRLLAQGIGPIAEEWVSLCGLWGGGLRSNTDDGWRVDSHCFDWPKNYLILRSPRGHDILDTRYPIDATVIGIDSEIRAFGFSVSGMNLVLATSDSLWLWRRAQSV